MLERQGHRTWRCKRVGADVHRVDQANPLLDEDRGSMSRSKRVVHRTEKGPSMALAKPERDQSKGHEEGARRTGRWSVQRMSSCLAMWERRETAVACRWGSCHGN
jgi:hypothetical protein